jgi:hypothetical protein
MNDFTALALMNVTRSSKQQFRAVDMARSSLSAVQPLTTQFRIIL